MLWIIKVIYKERDTYRSHTSKNLLLTFFHQRTLIYSIIHRSSLIKTIITRYHQSCGLNWATVHLNCRWDLLTTPPELFKTERRRVLVTWNVMLPLYINTGAGLCWASFSTSGPISNIYPGFRGWSYIRQNMSANKPTHCWGCILMPSKGNLLLLYHDKKWKWKVFTMGLHGSRRFCEVKTRALTLKSRGPLLLWLFPPPLTIPICSPVMVPSSDSTMSSSLRSVQLFIACIQPLVDMCWTTISFAHENWMWHLLFGSY